MRQGRNGFVLAVALATGALAVLPLVAPGVERVDAAATSTADSEAKEKTGQRQFTGIVIALEKGTITVEKPGKRPQRRVFSRHPEMTTEGEIVKAARVTVFYREKEGRAIAHRVVVKSGDRAPRSER